MHFELMLKFGLEHRSGISAEHSRAGREGDTDAGVTPPRPSYWTRCLQRHTSRPTKQRPRAVEQGKTSRAPPASCLSSRVNQCGGVVYFFSRWLWENLLQRWLDPLHLNLLVVVPSLPWADVQLVHRALVLALLVAPCCPHTHQEQQQA